MNILKCKSCNLYTLKGLCPKCSKHSTTTKPARYSPLDVYGRYRRIYKKEIKTSAQPL